MGLAGLSIEGMEFSSVRIKLSACSDESLSRLRKVLLADPAAIKHMLVNMMTKGHLHQLKQREVRTVTIELHVPKDKTIASKTCFTPS